jgi:hypothetical protein
VVHFQLDDDRHDGDGIHGKTRKKIIPVSNFSVSFRGFRRHRENQHSGEPVNIRYFRVERIPARNSASVQVALLSYSQL